MTLTKSNLHANAESYPAVIEKDSAFPLLVRRLSASFVDAIIFGTICAAMVYAQMCVIRPEGVEVDAMAKAIGAGLAFALGFLDVMTFSGILVYLVIACVLNYYSFYNPAITPYQIAFLFQVLPLNIIYHVAFENSSGAATIGKRLFGLQVDGVRGGAPGFKRVVKRHCAKTVSGLLVLFPPLHLLYGNRRQLLHDRIAGVQILERNSKVGQPLAKTHSPGEFPEVICASLWRRLPAAILDYITTSIIATIAFCAAFLAGAYTLPTTDTVTDGFVVFFLNVILSYIASAVVAVVAMAALESSALQSTPGKMVMGLKVTNLSFTRITFIQSVYKQAIQAFLYVSIIPIVATLMIPVVYISIAFKMDAMIVTGLAGWASFYLIYGATVCATFFKNRQSLLDVLCKRFVLVESASINQSLMEL